MTYDVELTARAERDISRIFGWLHQRSPRGAAAWARRCKDVVRDLAGNASGCPLAPENGEHDEEIRHVIFRTRRSVNYRALFVIRERKVFVIHVRGPGQDIVSPADVRLPQ
jgi:plasmid stabilization system protein ParE